MNPLITATAKKLATSLIKPYSATVTGQRREIILNVLLVGLLCVSTTISLVVIHDLIAGTLHSAMPCMAVIASWLVIVCLVLTSRAGHPLMAAMLLVILLYASAVQFSIIWGVEYAVAELMFALVVLCSGILFPARTGLVALVVVILSVLFLDYLQAVHMYVPALDWHSRASRSTDVYNYIMLFIAMGMIELLATKETDATLKRAKDSEAAVQHERDNLERKVIERTHELEELQLNRLLELQPFAELGRIGATLVHEIANPLTAAVLHLEELNKQQHSELVCQVQRNLQQLERYLLAARKQIKRESALRVFSVGAEIRQVANLISHRARQAQIKIVVEKIANLRLYGDSVKFNQLIANLLANAIEASELHRAIVTREIRVRAHEEAGRVYVQIIDHGAGISAHNLEHLFEPFYSTKLSIRAGLGIGLAMVKQYVEEDFRGSVQVVSDANGTIFNLVLRGQERNRHRH